MRATTNPRTQLRRLPVLVAATGASAILAAAAATVTAGPAAAQGTATVSILHAVPGATVDVYANGKELLDDFKPGTLTKPQMLPAGTYTLKVVKAGAGAGGAAVAQASASVPAGANITVVAHLNAAGKPELTPYVNDVSSIPAGKARLIVRHDAAAPAVDIRADKAVVFAGLTNPGQKSALVAAGTVSADVVLAGTSTVAIGPAPLNLREGTTTIVYAWGSAGDKNLALAVQTISGMGSNPSGVPGGTGGQAAAASPAWWGLAGVGAAGAITAMIQLRRQRRRVGALR